MEFEPFDISLSESESLEVSSLSDGVNGSRLAVTGGVGELLDVSLRDNFETFWANNVGDNSLLLAELDAAGAGAGLGGIRNTYLHSALTKSGSQGVTGTDIC